MWYENTTLATKVKVVVCDVEPVAFVLRSSWSTHLLNFATWDSMISLFPVSALREKEMFVFSVVRLEHLRSFDQYIRIGFERICGSRFSWTGEFKRSRFIGDEYTVCVPFSSRVAPDGELLDYAFEVHEEGIRLIGREVVIGV